MLKSDLLRNPKSSPLSLSANSSRTASLPCHGSRRRHSSEAPTLHFLSLCPLRSRSCVGPVWSLRKSRLQAPSADTAMSPGGLDCVAEDGFLANGESELPVDLCLTRTLPPALTLAEAVGTMKEEIAKLKSEPLCAGSGVLRLQVAVPPNIKPLNWLFSQLSSLNAFPQFYFSRSLTDGSGLVPLSDGMIGISGIGAAVFIEGSSSLTSRAKKLLRLSWMSLRAALSWLQHWCGMIFYLTHSKKQLVLSNSKYARSSTMFQLSVRFAVKIGSTTSMGCQV